MEPGYPRVRPGHADLFIAVGGRRSVPSDVLDAFLNLSLQVVLGERGCRAHAELEHRAHHDHLTGIELARQADMAMYSAKTGGKNRVERFAPPEHFLAA